MCEILDLRTKSFMNHGSQFPVYPQALGRTLPTISTVQTDADTGNPSLYMSYLQASTCTQKLPVTAFQGLIFILMFSLMSLHKGLSE